MAEAGLSSVLIPATEVEIDRSDDGVLGRGGYGMVYKGKYLGQTVAVKMFLNEGTVDKRAKDNLMKEARRLQQASDHENILNLFGVIMERNNYSLILEYMEFGTSISFVQDYDVPVPLRVKFVKQVVSAMAWLHAKRPPVKHLDLKADNVLINKNFDAKVCDFGLSLWHTVTAAYSTQRLDNGPRCGTLSHVPPEVLLDIHKKGSPEEDVYAFAVTTWEIFSGEMPYRGLKGIDMIRMAVLNNQRPDIKCLVKDCPQEVRDMIMTCWDMKPECRPSFTGLETFITPVYNRYEPLIPASIRHIIKDLPGEQRTDLFPNGDIGRTATERQHNGQVSGLNEEVIASAVAAATRLTREHSQEREMEGLDSKVREDGLESEVEENLRHLDINTPEPLQKQGSDQRNGLMPSTSKPHANHLKVLSVPHDVDTAESSRNNTYSQVPISESGQPLYAPNTAILNKQEVGLSGYVSLKSNRYIPGHEIRHPRGVITHPESEMLESQHGESQLASERNGGVETSPISAQTGISVGNHPERVAENSSMAQIVSSSSPTVTSATVPKTSSTEAGVQETPAALATHGSAQEVMGAAAGQPAFSTTRPTQLNYTSMQDKAKTNYQTQPSHDAPPPTPHAEHPSEQGNQRDTDTPAEAGNVLSQPLTNRNVPSQNNRAAQLGNSKPLGSSKVTVDQFSGEQGQSAVANQGVMHPRLDVPVRNPVTTEPEAGQPMPTQRLFPATGQDNPQPSGATLRPPELPEDVQTGFLSDHGATASNDDTTRMSGKMKEVKRPAGGSQGSQTSTSLNAGTAGTPITISHKHAGGGFTTITMNPNIQLPPNLQIGNNNVMYVNEAGENRKSTKKKKQKKCKKSELTASEAELGMDNIDLVAVEIGKDWKNLCRQLGMSEADIEHLQYDYHVSGLYEIMYQGIQRWIQRNGRSATVRKMAEALWEIDRDDIARRLR